MKARYLVVALLALPVLAGCLPTEARDSQPKVDPVPLAITAVAPPPQRHRGLVHQVFSPALAAVKLEKASPAR